jgi:hypothetical protein
MQKGKRARPSPAMIVAIVALVVGLGGTSFAAVKLGKNSVKAKNLKSNSVTEKKIKDGAVSLAKLGASGKSLWYESALGNGRAALRQSGGITAIADANIATATVVNFGQDVSKRAISVTPSLNLGAVAVEYARCLDVSCGGGLTGSPNAVLVVPFDASGVSPPVNSGFTIVASP